MKRDFTLLLLCAMSQGISAQDMVEVTNSEISLLNRTKSHQRVSVHDPSIVDTGTGTYYIFGTHNAVARSTDLINWSGVDNSRLYGLRNSNGVVTATDFNNAFEKNMTTKVTALVNYSRRQYMGSRCDLEQGHEEMVYVPQSQRKHLEQCHCVAYSK